MKRLLISLLVLGFAVSMTALATEKKAADAKAPTVAKKADDVMKNITVTGKLECKKEGKKSKYILKTTHGKIDLPEAKDIKDLDKMVGKEINVIGQGKEEGKKVHLKSIKSVTLAKAKVPKAAKTPKVKTPEKTPAKVK